MPPRSISGGVDVMVNNSGFNGAEAMPHEMSLEDWQRVIDVNVTGTFLGAKAALKLMLERGKKRNGLKHIERSSANTAS